MTDMSSSAEVGGSEDDKRASVEQRPPVNAGWAVAALLFFWPLSFAAFTHAFNVHPMWSEGDHDGARNASKRVRWLGQVSLWIGGSIAVVLVAVYVVVSAVWIDGHRDHGASPSFTGAGYCDFDGGFSSGGDFGGGDFGGGDFGSFDW
ncbi:interferon-induced transmembrane protein [Rhodococcus sp. OK519]|uniref:CD225/dispanin family protein n=1 Tax=Rhodococcus sp. OK519 TaxID=2135729 RepID=UPI000D33E932|nr:interferon-induced transmembrane protein [Rhodococcus sp. OK519]